MEKEKIDFEPEGVAETPYLRAKQDYDDLIGSSRIQAKNWRLAFFASFLIVIVLSAGLIYQSSKATVTPYIIEVDKTGSVNFVGKPVAANYKPKQAAIKHFLSQFIVNIRSVPTDPIVMRKNFLNAYNFVTTKGKNTLDNYAMVQDPFSKIGDMAIAVEISSVSEISENSFQVEWLEQVFSQSGLLKDRSRYTSIINFIVKKPKNEKMLLSNPLGIFIDFFSVSKELS